MMQTQTFSSRTTFARIRSDRTRFTTTKRFVARAESKVVREYREGDDEVSVPKNEDAAAPSNPQSVYADQLPEIPRTEISDSMKARLREEYLGLGGSPNQAMGGNYFLYIILIIAFLAVLSAALGYI